MVSPWYYAAVGVGVAGAALSRVDWNLFFMRFFRDLARGKARARLYNNPYAVIPVILGVEQPMKFKDDIDAEDRMTITREELEEYDGFEGAPLYLAVKKRVYDVSKGGMFYGEGKEYHNLVGKDASRAFGTGCRSGNDRTGHECMSENLEGLNRRELREVERWLELYETHDKYTFVGHLIDDPLDDLIEQYEKEEAEEEAEEEAMEERSRLKEINGEDDEVDLDAINQEVPAYN